MVGELVVHIAPATQSATIWQTCHTFQHVMATFNHGFGIWYVRAGSWMLASYNSYSWTAKGKRDDDMNIWDYIFGAYGITFAILATMVLITYQQSRRERWISFPLMFIFPSIFSIAMADSLALVWQFYNCLLLHPGLSIFHLFYLSIARKFQTSCRRERTRKEICRIRSRKT